ncbi:MAG: sulfite exporter TauE/SafE family protein [Gammaproteobacteria bacterium]|jgi:uncharacterized membrane protein YfcA
MTVTASCPAPSRLHTLLIGLIAGFGGGLASLGGGTLLIPLLTGPAGLSSLEARGTALAVATVSAVTGTAVYAHGGRVDWLPLLWTGIPALIVAPLTARWSKQLPAVTLRRAFGVIVLIGGIVLLMLGEAQLAGFAHGWRDPYLLGVGLLAGTVAGVVGVSGGPVLAPLFVLGLGMPQALAQGTSLVTRLPATLTGLGENAREGNVCWGLLPTLVIGAFFGALAGARIALLLPEPVLRSVFGVLLILLGVYEILGRPGHPARHHHHDPYP